MLLGVAAIGRLAGVTRSRPSHWEAVAEARAYLDAGRPGLALRAVEGVRGSGPGAGEAFTVAGMALAALDRREESRRALERGLELQPDQPMAHKVLAAISLSSGDYDRGLEHLRSAARLDPTEARPWIAMGKAHHDLGQDDQSVGAYEEALRRDPASREARIGLVTAALKSNRPDWAAPHLAEALRDAPEDVQVLGLAARHARALGHPEQATDFAGRALALDPDNFDALVTRATSSLLSGESRSALDDLERAVRVNSISIEALRLLAQAESRLGLSDRARRTMARARTIEAHFATFDRLTKEIAQRPNDPEPRWRMGEVASQADMPEVAANSFRAALAIDPRCQPARKGLAALRAARALPAALQGHEE